MVEKEKRCSSNRAGGVWGSERMASLFGRTLSAAYSVGSAVGGTVMSYAYYDETATVEEAVQMVRSQPPTASLRAKTTHQPDDSLSDCKTDGRTDARTDRRIDGRTDGYRKDARLSHTRARPINNVAVSRADIVTARVAVITRSGIGGVAGAVSPC
jgi:hypothetical protein